MPGIKNAGYTIDKATARTPPIFKWNCPADVAIVAERLKRSTVHPDNIAGDVDGLIRFGRDYGLYPNKIFLLLKQTFPVLGNSVKSARPHLIKLERTDPRFPRPVWISGEKFYWHDEILKFIDACASAPPPPKNLNLRNGRGISIERSTDE